MASRRSARGWPSSSGVQGSAALTEEGAATRAAAPAPGAADDGCDAPLELSVVLPEGNTIALRAPARSSVAALKELLFDKTGIPARQQRLLRGRGGDELQDGSSLASHGVRGGQTLHLSLDLGGGGDEAWLADPDDEEAWTLVAGPDDAPPADDDGYENGVPADWEAEMPAPEEVAAAARPLVGVAAAGRGAAPAGGAAADSKKSQHNI